MKTEMTKQFPSIMAMWSFLNENMHFKLSKYEFVEGGVKVIYSAHTPKVSQATQEPIAKMFS